MWAILQLAKVPKHLPMLVPMLTVLTATEVREVAGDAHLDRPRGPRVADRVVDEVVQQLRHEARITPQARAAV